jgi:hypothetical protein
LVGNLTGHAKAEKHAGNNNQEAHLDNRAVVLSFRLFPCRRLIASHPKTAKEGHIAGGTMSVILVPQKVRLYWYPLWRADVHRLNLGTWTRRGWALRDWNSHYSLTVAETRGPLQRWPFAACLRRCNTSRFPVCATVSSCFAPRSASVNWPQTAFEEAPPH